MRLSGHSLCKQCLTGSGRAHEQSSLGKSRADLHILSGIMQKVHDLLQRFLGLVLSRHILEGNSGLLLDIDLGVILADSHNSAASSAHTVHEKVEQAPDDQQGQHIA